MIRIGEPCLKGANVKTVGYRTTDGNNKILLKSYNSEFNRYFIDSSTASA
jgi:hypothetical protein